MEKNNEHTIIKDGQYADYEAWFSESISHRQLFEFGDRKTQRYLEDSNRRSPRGRKYVQCWISNIAFPTTLQDLLHLLNFGNGWFNVEDISNESRALYWTAPQWAKPNDIVFFMHSKTAISKITRLCTFLEEEKNHFTSEEYILMKNGLARARVLYKQYGGKIFGVAKVVGFPERYINEDDSMWNGRVFADMAFVKSFQHPLDISEFRDFITISRTGAITPIFDSQYTLLREKLATRNALPEYVLHSDADPEALGHINARNWLELANRYRMHFMLEEQFRAYYVNYLLRSMTKYVSRECRCIKKGISDSFADNVIRIGKKYLPVEVKLLVNLWPINDQVRKYCYDDEIHLDSNGTIIKPNQIWTRNALVIDTQHVYMYNADSDSLNKIFNLDNLSFDGIQILRKKIVDILTENENT